MKHQNTELDDAALVTAVLSGEHEAFEPLFARYYDSLVRLGERLLGSTAEAQDIAQEAALQAFLGLRRLQDPARFGPWLYAIATNLARMALRRRTSSLEGLSEEIIPIRVWSDANSLPPEEVYVTQEIHQQITSALSELVVDQREAVVKFYLEGYSYAELAVLFGIPVSTVKWRLHAGRKQLRRSLQPLVSETLTLNKLRSEKESTMESPTQAQLQIVAFGYPSPGERLIVLREIGSYWELSIPISAAEAVAIDYALENKQFPQPSTHDLMVRLLTSLGAYIARIVIHKLVCETFYAQIVVRHGGQEYQVEARPSDALVVAVQSDAPIVVERDVLEKGGEDLTNIERLKEAQARAMEALKEQLAAHPKRVVPAPLALDPETQRQVEAILERVRSSFKGRIALLKHRSGALVAWQGTGDSDMLARWSAAKVRGERDLAEALTYAVYPDDEVGGVVFMKVHSDYQLEVALPLAPEQVPLKPLTKGNPYDPRDNFYQNQIEQAARELEALLPTE